MTDLSQTLLLIPCCASKNSAPDPSLPPLRVADLLGASARQQLDAGREAAFARHVRRSDTSCRCCSPTTTPESSRLCWRPCHHCRSITRRAGRRHRPWPCSSSSSSPLSLDPSTLLPLGERLNDFTAPRVAELTYTAWDLQAWAADIGYPGAPFRWDDDRRELLRAELDAAFFHVYGLDRDETEHVLDTFTVLEKYETRPPEKGGYGEFRTKRLVLERYDAMSRAVDSQLPYNGALEPPPAHPSLRHEVS